MQIARLLLAFELQLAHLRRAFERRVDDLERELRVLAIELERLLRRQRLLHLGELRSIIPRRLRIMWRYHGVTKKGAAFIVQANKPNLLGIYVIKRLRTMASKV